MNLFRTVAIALALAVPVSAQVPPGMDCPHIGVRTEAPRFDVVGTQTCDAGIAGNFGTINIQASHATCPLLILITPTRDVPAAVPGCWTYAAAAGHAAVERIAFTCETTWLLFIPLYDTCVPKPPEVVNRLTDYAAVPCWMSPKDFMLGEP